MRRAVFRRVDHGSSGSKRGAQHNNVVRAFQAGRLHAQWSIQLKAGPRTLLGIMAMQNHRASSQVVTYSAQASAQAKNFLSDILTHEVDGPFPGLPPASHESMSPFCIREASERGTPQLITARFSLAAVYRKLPTCRRPHRSSRHRRHDPAMPPTRCPQLPAFLTHPNV